ncbi:MAG: creatininase family protein [Alphaproteobacteria bacterium]|nr:creatininase family protein [Alphaproteobacteria bacterium]
MSLPSRYWQDLTTEEFSSLDVETVVAVLPVAAVEQHGPHLPVWVDACICEAVVVRALEQLPPELPVLALPMLPIGHSPEHGDFAGTLTLAPETVLRLWAEIGESVADAGVRRLALVNSHGGQPQLLDLAAQRLRADRRMLVSRINAYRYFRDATLFSEAEIRFGIHGGAIETSLMLHLRPDLVRMDRIDDFTPDAAKSGNASNVAPFGEAGVAWQAQDLHPSGACGDARLAEAEKGKTLLDLAAAAVARALEDLARADLAAARDAT